MKKEKMDKEFIQFAKDALSLKDDEAAVELITGLNKINYSLKKNKKSESSDSPELFFNLLIIFKNNLIDKIQLPSINEILNKFYKLNYSYVNKDESKNILKLFKSYSKKKTVFDTKSFSDMKDIINLFNSYGDQIISNLFPKDKNKKINPQVYLSHSKTLERFSKIYSATCALKEIAYARSIIKDQIDVELVSSIVKISLYSQPHFFRADTLITNPYIEDLIVSLKGHKNINVRWEPINKLKAEAREIANNFWSNGDTRYHNEVAKDIYNIQKNSHPEIRGTTEFTEADFNAPYSVRNLCQAINNDTYKLQLKKPDNTIDRLNEILRINDLAQIMDEKYDDEELPSDVEKLFNKTEKIRTSGESFTKLKNKEKQYILRLNRSLLEIIYPKETPRRPEKDLSRYYSVKTVREAIIDIAENYGLKWGGHPPKQ